MANEIRVRGNLTSGTLSVALASGDTTMSSAGLTNLLAVTAANHAVIVIENELVYVTAHTAAATTATILRAQEGTSAASHALNVAWVHGPVASDFVQTYQWTAWTPTLTNMTLGNGTLQAAYAQLGKTVHYRFRFSLGSTSAMGTDPRFSLPVAANAAYPFTPGPESTIGDVNITDFGTANYRGQVWLITNTSTARLIYFNTSAQGALPTATLPMTWAVNDTIFASGTYEAA